jgi:hypothetical protein
VIRKSTDVCLRRSLPLAAVAGEENTADEQSSADPKAHASPSGKRGADFQSTNPAVLFMQKILLLLAGAGVALSPLIAAAGRPDTSGGGTLSTYFENDLFAGTDRYYTNKVKVS